MGSKMMTNEMPDQRNIVEQSKTWYCPDTEHPDITVEKFEAFCEHIYNQNKYVKDAKTVHEDASATLTMMKSKILKMMEGFEKVKYSSNQGTLSVVDKLSVKVPKLPEEKEKLFEWLQEKEIFNQYATVNANSLNSLYKAEMVASGDPDFRMPGVEEAKPYKQLSIRSK